MKSTLMRFVSSVTAMGLLAGCIGTPVHLQAAPAAQTQGPYRYVKGEACGFQLFFLLPLSVNSRVRRSYEEMVERADGEAIYDIEVDEHWFYGFVGTGYCTSFRGKAVITPLRVGADPSATPAPLARPQSPAMLPAAVPMDVSAEPPMQGSAPALPASAPAPATAAGVRSEGEIRAVLSHQKSAFDHAVAVATGGDGTAGTVVVAFTVQPDGSVTQTQIVSSTLASAPAQVAVLQQLSKVTFQAKAVAAQRVIGFPVQVN